MIRALPPHLTSSLAARLDELHVSLFHLCMGTGTSADPPEHPQVWLAGVLKLGGMGITSAKFLRYSGYLGC